MRWNEEDKDIPVEERKPIKVYIASPGGALEVQRTLSSIIELSKTPVYAVAIGGVMSAAALIYLSCHRRYALPSAYFLLHHGSCENMSGNFEELVAMMNNYQAQIEEMNQFIAKRTDYTKDELNENIFGDWYIYLDEAVEKGIVTD